MRVYCTLFDHRYLSRGLALYESLVQYEKEMVLYILAMDEPCYEALARLELHQVVLIHEKQFENEELKRLKQERGRAEYCWTCTSFLIEYVLDRTKAAMCTYLDSDIFFFQSPENVFEELRGMSVLITPHHFAEYCNMEKTSGKYCVQFLTFVDDERGRAVLSDWKQKCIECCEISPERGHCGDQKYLDDWIQNFEGVRETEGLGIGVAPWNAARFSVCRKEDGLFVYENKLKKEYPLIFYHFHGLQFYDKDMIRLTHPAYEIKEDAVSNIYAEYISIIEKVHQKYGLEKEINYDGKKSFQTAQSEGTDKNYYRKSALLQK